FNQAKFWNGKEGWIGESSASQRNVYRYSDIEKLFTSLYPSEYPHWDAAGGQLLWNGPNLTVKESEIPPAMTDYIFSKTEVIDGEECDVFDGPGRSEKLWVTKSTGLLKAMSRYYGNTPKDGWLETANKVTGRDFSSMQEYRGWVKKQSEKALTQISARWAEASWPNAKPGNLSVFSDYREIAPGVMWPMKVDRIVVHSNWNGTKSTGTYKYYYSSISTTETLRQFSMAELARMALPEPGLKVTDRRNEVPVEYEWTEAFDEEDARRALNSKLATKRKQDEEINRINATPINSVDDAMKILKEGPKVEPVKVWARAINYLTDHPQEAVPKLIAAIDSEKDDHPLSKYAFAARAIGDRRSIPALIRAIPRTLLPGRSDYGLIIKDDKLGAFLQKHDLDPGEPGNWNDAWRFGYGRAQREVFGTLQSMTGQKMDEFELRFVHLQGTKRQRQTARRQFDRVAEQWAIWWEANWNTLVDDAAYSKVGLASKPLAEPATPRDYVWPTGPKLILESVSKGGTVQLISESESSCCFLDLDTGRTAGWPKELGKQPTGADANTADLRKLTAWARKEGFDVLGIKLGPKGKDKPRYCVQPIGMQTWKITPDEYRRLPDAMHGKTKYPLSRPVKMMVPDEPMGTEQRGEGNNAFLFVTNEGTAGVMILTAQVTEIGGGGGYSTSSNSTRGFFRGVRYELRAFVTSVEQP
ncbi:MAG: hypothetical protein AAF497_12850, partial [Planctomycetota bacterium]